jgi:hypothetical protein
MAGLLGAKYDEWMTPERSIKMGAYGDILSGLGSGQSVNLAPAYQALQKRKQDAAWQERMNSDEFAGMFDDRQMKALASMPGQQAQAIIHQRMFAAPVARKAPVFHDGQWWDVNGKVPQVVAGELPTDKPDVTADIENFQFYQQDEINAGRIPVAFQDWRLTKPASTTLNVNTGIKAPSGYMIDPNDPNAIVPIPGGAAATSVVEDDARTASRDAAKLEDARFLSDTIGRAKDILTNDPFTTTGIVGSVAGFLPGTKRTDLEELLTTVAGNLGFEELQAIRNNSKTGGGVGALSDNELRILSSLQGSLSPNQSDEQLLLNLQNIQDTRDRLIADATARKKQSQTPASTAKRTDAELEEIYGKP